MARLFQSFLFLTCFATVLAANKTHERDPNTTPIGGFVPKKLPAYVAIALYGISAIIHWIHFFTVRPRRLFMLTLPLGMTAMATGFIIRLINANPPFTLGKYIAMTLFILLSPCLFLATDYMILSHLARTFDQEVSDRCLLIRHSRITKFFVWSDVSTFFLQSAGGGLTAIQGNASLANLGNKIVLIGLVLQAVSFGLFTIVLLTFGFRVSTHFPQVWRPKNLRPFKIFSRQLIDDWRIVFYLTCLTCIGILVRSIFRIAEYAGGYSGTIATHEGYFYGFDTLPLWIAMSLYCIVWPTRAFAERSGLVSDSRMELKPAYNA
ncbi:RTA1 like protein-domain-containing protein [Mycena leptocephala]|nr:RTA1 like protein-domain-containing protein [Mycena leptocephala]